MSLQSWQQGVGMILVFVALSLVAVNGLFAFCIGAIGGAFVGYGITVKHPKGCMCLNCVTPKVIEYNRKKDAKNQRKDIQSLIREMRDELQDEMKNENR